MKILTWNKAEIKTNQSVKQKGWYNGVVVHFLDIVLFTSVVNNLLICVLKSKSVYFLIFSGLLSFVACHTGRTMCGSDAALIFFGLSCTCHIYCISFWGFLHLSDLLKGYFVLGVFPYLDRGSKERGCCSLYRLPSHLSEQCFLR